MSELAPLVAAALRDKVVLEQQEEIARLRANLAKKEEDEGRGKVLITGRNGTPIFYESEYFKWGCDNYSGNGRLRGTDWGETPSDIHDNDYLEKDEFLIKSFYRLWSKELKETDDFKNYYSEQSIKSPSLIKKTPFEQEDARSLEFIYDNYVKDEDLELLYDMERSLESADDNKERSALAMLNSIEVLFFRGAADHPCCSIGGWDGWGSRGWDGIQVKPTSAKNPLYPNQKSFYVSLGPKLPVGFDDIEVLIGYVPGSDSEERQRGTSWRVESIEFTTMIKTKSADSLTFIYCSDVD